MEAESWAGLAPCRLYDTSLAKRIQGPAMPLEIIDHRLRLLSPGDPRRVLGCEGVALGVRLLGKCSQMGCHEDIVHVEQGIIRRRGLFLQDIKPPP